MSINGSVVTKEIVAPYFFEKLVSCEGDVLVFHQIKEQIVLLGRHGSLLAVNVNLSARNVNFKSFKGVLIGLGSLLCGLAALEHDLDSRHEFLRRKRLYNIVVYAYFKAKKLVVFLTSCGKHYHRDILGFMYLLAG